MDPDDVIGARVVVRGPAEDVVPDFLLVNRLEAPFEHAIAEIQEQVAQPGRFAEDAARRDSPDQDTAFIARPCVGRTADGRRGDAHQPIIVVLVSAPSWNLNGEKTVN